MIGDSAYPSLLQGVSQQVLQHRKEGQLSSQTNMLADAVTGLRRRPGIEYKTVLAQLTDVDSVRSAYTEFEGKGYHLIVNSKLGKLTVLNTDFTVHSEHTDSYLIAENVTKIRSTTVSGLTWFLNTEKVPVLGTSGLNKTNPDYDGFFYILVGAYSKSYAVTIRFTGFYRTYIYTTPNGANLGDLALSTTEGIAGQLVGYMLADSVFNAAFDIYREQNYVFITRKNKNTTAGGTSVTVSGGKTYIIGSGTMNVALVADLPANLPAEGNNTVCSVGNSTSARSYFRWDDARGVWTEVGSYSSADTIANMPRSFSIVNDVGTLSAPVFEGRLAGDQENNPYPNFIGVGISGMSAYQGRLVLLSGAYTTMSVSNKPLRFMRSTTVDIRSDDPIEIGAGALASANFEYAVPFNKDLVLFSSAYQAVIPAGNTGITASNAMVLLSSNSAVDTTAEPRIIGRTVMYGTDVSSEFFGIGELVPSQYSGAQYTAQNLTEHIPRYISGRCRSIIDSSSSSIGLFLSSLDFKSVLVNEYIWSGDERIQNAFHKWEFAYDVLSMHFVRGSIVVLCKSGGNILIGTIDTRAASYQQSGVIPPFLDYYSEVIVVDNEFSLPVHLRDLAFVSTLRLAQNQGALSGEPVGIESIDTSTWVVRTVRSFKNGTLAVGWRFVSSFAPSSPLVRDNDRAPIVSAQANVLRYLVNVRNTGEFNIQVDITSVDDIALGASGLLWSSNELGLGNKQTVDYGTIIVPVRAMSEKHVCTLFVDSTRELNVISIEYTLRGVSKRKQI